MNAAESLPPYLNPPDSVRARAVIMSDDGGEVQVIAQDCIHDVSMVPLHDLAGVGIIEHRQIEIAFAARHNGCNGTVAGHVYGSA